MIKLLPEHLIDQIKAGEVIERPANLIKELLENSIDAHSTKIDIHLIDNGLEKISIQDNGDGIESRELPLAFCRHATSKLENFEDLYHLFTYGFRGEALASIAAISDVTCTTHHEKTQSGGQIHYRGGKEVSFNLIPYISHSKGTTFFIKELFFNTPARLKFIQSKSSEKNALKKTIEAFFLSHPEISFSLKWDDQDKDIYPATIDLKRVERVFSGKIMSVEKEFEDLKLRVFATENPTGKKHYFFINGRYLIDPKIHRIIVQSLEGLWGPGQSGSYCLFLDLPREKVDVNVHPHKTQVKLADSGKVYSLLSSTLKLLTPSKITVNENIKKNETNENYSESLSFSHYFQNATPEHSQVALHLPPHWAIIQTSSTYMAFNYAKALGHYIVYHFLKEKSPESVPLLIGVPLIIEENISKLKNYEKEYNIGIEQIDTNEFLLTSIPRCLEFLPYKEIIKATIEGKDQITDFFNIDLNISEIIWLTTIPSFLENFGLHFDSSFLDQLNDAK